MDVKKSTAAMNKSKKGKLKSEVINEDAIDNDIVKCNSIEIENTTSEETTSDDVEVAVGYKSLEDNENTSGLSIKEGKTQDTHLYKWTYMLNNKPYKVCFTTDDSYPNIILKNEDIPDGYEFDGWNMAVYPQENEAFGDNILYPIFKKISKQDNKKLLSDYSLNELLSLKDANDIIIAYYDNLVKSCTGMYDYAIKERYNTLMQIRTKYQNADLTLIEEIEKRLDVIL